MLPRLHLADITTVVHYLGVLVIMTGMLMVIPALVAAGYGEIDNLVAFVFGAGVCSVSGALLRLVCRPRRFTRRAALLLVGIGWVVVSLFASIPLYLSGDFSSYVNALFDAISALTTTGATLVDDVDHIGASQVVWRTLLAIVGGQAVIVIAMYLRVFGEGGDEAFLRERGAKGGRNASASQGVRSILFVMSVYLVVGTSVLFAVGLVRGAPPADALVESFALVGNALNTCGFVAHTSGLIYYHSLGIDAVMAVCLLLGATNFLTFVFLMRGKGQSVRRSSELRSWCLWLALLVAAVTVAMTRSAICTSAEGLLVNGTFTVISAATTGGMQTVYPAQYGGALDESVLIILCVALLFGACSFSTGGGIKVNRIVMVLRWVGASILRVVLPRNAQFEIRYEQFGARTLTARAAMSAMTVFILYLAAAALGSMLFIAHGNDSVQSVFEAVSYVSNTGMTAGLSSQDMGIDLKVVAMLLMWMGRAEFIAVFAAIAGILISLKPANMTGSARKRKLLATKRRTRGGAAWRNRKTRNGAGRSAPCVAVAVLSAALVCAGASVPVAQGALDTPSIAQVPASEIETLGDGAAYRELSISELLSATSRLDDESVEVTGEVVGSAISADEGHVWVNLEQDGSMIGVYLDDELASQIATYGGYGVVGDMVTVRGTYHLACDEHAGELEVHATQMTVDDEGYSYERTWSQDLLVAGLACMLAAALLTLVRYLWLRHRNINPATPLWR